MERFFLKIYDFFAGGRRYMALLLPILLAGCFYLCMRHITLNEDIAAFLPYGSGENSRQSQFVYKNLRMQDKVVSLMSLKEKPKDTQDVIERLTQAADEYSERFLSMDLEGIKEPTVRIDPTSFLATASFVAENMPYFLEDEDYIRIDSIISNGNFAQMLEQDKESMITSNGLTQSIVAADPLQFSSKLLKKLTALGTESGFRVIGEYLFTPDSSAIMMNFSSEFGGSETGNNSQLLRRIYEIRDSVTALYPDVQMEFTGSPVIAVMNAERMKKDAVRCAVLAVVLIVGLLAWYFRRVRPILLICVPVIFGIMAGLAFMGLVKESVSSVALAACCVIFGIAVDYSLLYSTRLGFTSNARQTLSDIVSPMVIGNITTVGAFLSLLVMSASGMRDFGLFAAVSLVGAIFFVIIFLPHWVGEKNYKPKSNGWLGRWAGFRPEENRYIFWLLVVATVVFYLFSRKVTFSGDFTKINYMAPAQSQLLDKLSSYSGREGSVAVYAVTEGATLSDALYAAEKNRAFTDSSVKSGNVLSSRGIGPFLPSEKEQQRRLSLWKSFVEKNGETLLNSLEKAGEAAGFTSDAFDAFKTLFTSELGVQQEEFFSPIGTLMAPFILRDSSTSIVMEILYTPKENLSSLYSSYKDYGNKAEGSFLFDSYSMTDGMIDILQKDFDKVLAICSVLVFIFLWIAFRRLELALCAFLPMVVSWIWITGIMGIFGVSFNIVNIILATFIFGLGDDYTIFMVEGLQYEYTNKKPLLQSYKTGVTLSAITMFVGVGSLIFALHPALHSLGAVAVIGLICVVLLAFMLPPVIFRFLVCKSFRKERKERVLPIRLSDIFITLYCAAVFAAVCLWLKLITLFNPKLKGERLRSLITRYMRFFSSKMPRVKFFVKSEGKELKVKEIFEYTDRYFSSSEPCVIISNHQSHLDLLYYLSLSKKIVVVTNKWVYKSPVYGNFVRKAGNVCIEEGMEINREKLLSLKKEGCSILIFPEGTRSEDCDILKFRSGAFSMAEELQMDILPVVLFGPGEVFPKGEHLLRRGRVVLEFKERIPYKELGRFGTRALKQSQAMRRYYKEEYDALCATVYGNEDYGRMREKDKNLYKSDEEMV